MRSFAEIYQTACLHKGGEQAVEELLPTALSDEALGELSDAHCLSTMCRRVFRAGLKHSLVDDKWPAFEAAFQGFDPQRCAMLSDDDIDRCMKNTALIRHLGKLRAIRANAQFVFEQAKLSGSFGAYLAEWKSDDTVALWLDLKKRGAQLGGASGAAFLRMLGKDTFLLTQDVVAVLKREGVIERNPTSKRDMLACQTAFSTWQQECDRKLCEISRVVSFTAAL